MQGPLSAAWNCGELGSIPLEGPIWAPWPLGSGKSGTPWARMHLAKARLNAVLVRCPDPPDPPPPGMVTGPDPPPAPEILVADEDAAGLAGVPPHAAAPRARPADAASMSRARRSRALTWW